MKELTFHSAKNIITAVKKHCNEYNSYVISKDIPTHMLLGFLCPVTDTIFTIPIHEFKNTLYVFDVNIRDLLNRYTMTAAGKTMLCQFLSNCKDTQEMKNKITKIQNLKTFW